MEKRFALFLGLSALILVGHLTLQSFLAPPQPQRPQGADDVADVDGPVDPGDTDDGDAKVADAADATDATDGGTPSEPETDTNADSSDQVAEAEAANPDPLTNAADSPAMGADQPEVAEQWVVLGSLVPGSPYRLMVTLCNQGAAVERIELVQRTTTGRFRFQDLVDKSGYLGHLALRDATACRVNIVPPGSPAAIAKAGTSGVEPGLVVGDVIQQIDGQSVKVPDDFRQHLAGTKPGQTVEIQVSRSNASGETSVESFTALLTRHPLSVVSRETNLDAPLGLPDQLSMLFSLESVGQTAVARSEDEIEGLPSLRNENSQVKVLEDDGSGPAVEFRFRLDSSQLEAIDQSGELEIVKRYRLARIPTDQLEDSLSPSYHLEMELEILNLGSDEQQVAFRLDGPTGLPTEGWWYSNKIHPRFMAAAGSRDVLWNTPQGGRGLIGATQIYKETKEAEENNQAPLITLFDDTTAQPINYIGVDTPYFAVVIKPEVEDGASETQFMKALAIAAGDVGEKKKSKPKTTNSTFRLISGPQTIAANGKFAQRFTLFSGPKQPALLEKYDLERVIEYGWFRPIAKVLSSVLHFFERLPLVNYGFAIIMLTVLVRSCMIPLSRKATKNAAMMQELAPEMKAIAEKYKNEMEKRSAAQRELFAKNNYNPFGGCLLMFIQLPIFIGLYRSLSVDVELRQAPLISGMSWCSNLAGPDMLWYWKPYLPAMLADETGWLGPYFNILPIITIVLFLLQQKMFMPPATDDQTRMQQKMMKFMMIFMGVLFFRVPSGLCIYFIASSLWGLAERKLLPPPGKKKGAGTPAPDGKKPGESATKKLANMADKLTKKVGGDANVRTARSSRKSRKGR